MGLCCCLLLVPLYAQVAAEPFAITFVSRVLDTYNANANPALHKLLIHDNLSSHKSVEVLEAVGRQGHRVVCHHLTGPRTDQWNLQLIKYVVGW